MKSSLIVLSLAVLLAAGIGCSKPEMAETAATSPNLPAESEAPGFAGKAKLASDQRSREAPSVAPKDIPKRAVIRNGSLCVRVESVEKAEDKVVLLVQAIGGYVDSTESSDLATSTPNLHMKIRVPADQFDGVLDKLEALGTRLSKTISTEDVTATLVDMEARLKIMKAQEDVYRRLLSGSRSSQEMMDVQDKLMNLRGTIEGLEAQHKNMSRLAALSSIDLTLQQSAEGAVAASSDPNWAKEAWGSATSVFGSAARGVGTVLIWMLVFSPAWLPIVWLSRNALKSKSRARVENPQFDLSA